MPEVRKHALATHQDYTIVGMSFGKATGDRNFQQEKSRRVRGYDPVVHVHVIGRTITHVANRRQEEHMVLDEQKLEDFIGNHPIDCVVSCYQVDDRAFDPEKHPPDLSTSTCAFFALLLLWRCGLFDAQVCCHRME